MVFHTLLLFPSMVAAFCGVRMVLLHTKKTRSQKVLAIFFFMLSFFYFERANFFSHSESYKLYLILHMIDCFSSLSLFPTLYLYIYSLTKDKKFTWKSFISFIPGIAIGMFTFICYLLMGENNALDFIKSLESDNSTAFNYYYSIPLYKYHYLVTNVLYNFVAITQVIFMTFYSIVRIFKYNRQLKNYYSNLDDKSIGNNIKILVCLFVGILFCAVYIMLMGRMFCLYHYIIGTLYFIIWVIPVFLACYFAVKMTYTVEDFTRDKIPIKEEEILEEVLAKEAEQPEDILNKRYSQMASSLDNLMIKKNLFLQSSLKIDDVAIALQSNRTYVSICINKIFGCNFNDYVNHMRIDYSKKLLKENPSYSGEDIAAKCGFLTPSSFYRAFKKNENISPKDWMKTNN